MDLGLYGLLSLTLLTINFILFLVEKRKEKKNDELEEKRRNKKIETMRRSQERGKLTYIRKGRTHKFITWKTNVKWRIISNGPKEWENKEKWWVRREMETMWSSQERRVKIVLMKEDLKLQEVRRMTQLFSLLIKEISYSNSGFAISFKFGGVLCSFMSVLGAYPN